MSQLDQLKKHIKRGQVYRRAELANWSKSVDRHMEALVKEGTLQKVSSGVYYYPKESAFGKTPPDEKILVRSFLKDDRFLLTTLNAYNSLGVGTTQLYNERIVYNHKRHGEFKLCNKVFHFRIKPHFPKKLSEEFLIVDLVNNIEALEEDQDKVLKNVSLRVSSIDRKNLEDSIAKYGNVKTKKIFALLMQA